MSALISRDAAGVLVCLTPLVITCGCGSVVPAARRALKEAGVALPMVSSSGNPMAREYLKQTGLTGLVRSTATAKHAVLYNPLTGQYLDMYKAPMVQEFYDNVRTVATSR